MVTLPIPASRLPILTTPPSERSGVQAVTYRHNWGEDRVYFHDSAGKLNSIPACWTTVVAEDPFVAMAGNRCFFRFEDLLQLVAFVERLSMKTQRGDFRKGNYAAYVKRNMPFIEGSATANDQL
jgi:hypothetical protein